MSRASLPPPWGLAADANPFPLRTNNCLPSRLKIAAVGYQPVGMKPSTKLRPPLLTSTTAIALVSPFATSNVRPAGDKARELGVEVAGAFGKRLIEISSIGSRENVLYTQTVPLLLHATNRRWPSRDNSMALGCSPAQSSAR